MTTEIPVTEARQGGCQCGASHEATVELDARLLAHAIRHGAILGALSSLKPGADLELIAPHDPKPLLAQVSDVFGDTVKYDYVDRTPDAVRVRFTKISALA